ncbi:MAG: hypothetical protein FWF59_10275, partial [Turicibacter sp.]|nr:hypothetical protein [Turicibacter sp.]
PLRLTLETGGSKQTVTTAAVDFLPYHTDANWSKGVLDNIRKTTAVASFDAGVQEIEIGALEAGLIIERIFIYQEATKPKASYLGPKESFYVE